MKNNMELKTALSTFGLSPYEQEVYILLCQNEWVTILFLSRNSSIKRSTLYRVIDSLIEKGLVVVNIEDKRTFYKAADPIILESTILKEEKKVQEMRTSLKILISHITSLTNQQYSKTSVNFYRGDRGIAAMGWKIVQHKNAERIIFGNDMWWRTIGFEIAEEVREESVKSNQTIREILNTEIMKPNIGNSWTNNKEYLARFEERFIIRKLYPIENELEIVENSIYLYSIEKNEVVGIELINANYASLMRSLFETVWKQAKTMKEVLKLKS